MKEDEIAEKMYLAFDLAYEELGEKRTQTVEYKNEIFWMVQPNVQHLAFKKFYEIITKI